MLDNISKLAHQGYDKAVELATDAKDWTVAHKKDIAKAAIITSLAMGILGLGLATMGALSGNLLAFTFAETHSWVVPTWSYTTTIGWQSHLLSGSVLAVLGFGSADHLAKSPAVQTILA